MKLVINTPGTRISKRGNCFFIKKDNKKERICSKKVKQILISTSASITTDAIKIAIENDVDIVFMNRQGIPFGRIWNSQINSISTIRRKQLLLKDNTLGTDFIKEFISRKLTNQINHLELLAKNRRDERRDFIKQSVNKIRIQIVKINNIKNQNNIDNIRSTIQGYEGIGSRMYFRTLAYLLPDKYTFEARSRRPAKDEFNCMINYGYGMMYQTIERSCIKVGLDPHIGILHIDNYNKSALVFDLIELYRVEIDKIVFKLFTTKKITIELFDIKNGGFYLNHSGKRLIIYHYNKMMKNKVKYKGRNVELENKIMMDIQEIASRVLKEL